MKKVLVVGDESVSRALVDGLARRNCWVERANKLEDALAHFEQMDDEFDLIVICPENGLMEADETAAALKIAAENMPFVVVIKPGIVDDGVGAGIALGNIDKIVPRNEDIETILDAFRRGVISRR